MLHRCHDEAVVNAGDGQAQARGFVRQHEVVATFGIQRHAQAGEAVGQRLAVRTGAEDEAVGMVAPLARNACARLAPRAARSMICAERW